MPWNRHLCEKSHRKHSFLWNYICPIEKITIEYLQKLWRYCNAHPRHILDHWFSKIKSKYKWRKYFPLATNFCTKGLLRYLAYLCGRKADALKHLSIAEILRFLGEKMVQCKFRKNRQLYKEDCLSGSCIHCSCLAWIYNALFLMYSYFCPAPTAQESMKKVQDSSLLHAAWWCLSPSTDNSLVPENFTLF